MWLFRRRISPKHQKILSALAEGATLKAHRTMDGVKYHCLHRLNGEIVPVAESAVALLESRGLVKSNMKFPAATYLLTDKGKKIVQQSSEGKPLPLSSQNYPE